MADIFRVFNRDGVERMKPHTLAGQNYAISTFEFVDESVHPSAQLLEEVKTYFNIALSV
ncbi:MAG: hypothetical protein AB8H47_19430 [Bacteroidia bacterium]